MLHSSRFMSDVKIAAVSLAALTARWISLVLVNLKMVLMLTRLQCKRWTKINSSFSGHGCKKVPRQICKPAAPPACTKVPHQECKPTTEQKCHNVPKEHCAKVPRKVARKECHPVPKEHCEYVPKQACQAVPRQQCHPVTRQACEQVPHTECHGKKFNFNLYKS